MNVRLSLQKDRKAIESLSKRYKETKDFSYCWQRWGNWVSNPPIVVYDDKIFVGFHAAAYSDRMGYATSYFQAVEERYIGKGCGGLMLGFILKEMRLRRIRRMKFKTLLDADRAVAFWSGFGLRPFGNDGKQMVWDEDFGLVRDCSALVDWMKDRSQHQCIPEKMMAKYKRAGVELL